jgi:hypothetical protein
MQEPGSLHCTALKKQQIYAKIKKTKITSAMESDF